MRWPAERLCGFLLTLVRQIAHQRSPKSPQTMECAVGFASFRCAESGVPLSDYSVGLSPDGPSWSSSSDSKDEEAAQSSGALSAPLPRQGTHPSITAETKLRSRSSLQPSQRSPKPTSTERAERRLNHTSQRERFVNFGDWQLHSAGSGRLCLAQSFEERRPHTVKSAAAGK